MADRKAALTRKLTPSSAKAQPVPMVATIRPDSSGPTMWAPLCESERRALACCTRPGLTISGISPVEAGVKNESALPITSASAMRCQSSALPVMRRVETTACVAARTRSQATITRWRGRRSDQTPPTRVSTTRGRAKAANTRPRSPAEPVSSRTAKASATPTSESPMAEPVWPIQSRRNWRSESASPALRQNARSCSMPRA